MTIRAKMVPIFLMLLTTVFWFGCRDSNKEASQPKPVPAESRPTDRVEIFTWWTGPGEVKAFDAFLEFFHKKYPTVQVIDLAKVAGSGENAHRSLRRRIEAKRPPDSFLVYPQLFREFTESSNSQLAPLDSLYKLKYLGTKFPKSVLDAVSHNGHYLAVPLGIHRRNTMYYNPKLVSKPPQDLDALFETAAELKEKEVNTLAIGTATGDWPLMMLFDATLAGSAGDRFFKDFYEKKIDFSKAKSKANLKRAVSTFAKLLTFANQNGHELSWSDAVQLIIDGKAAICIQGDWATGYFISQNKVPSISVPPGTDNMFVFTVDSFALFKNAPNPATAKRFLNAIGSPEGQTVFNKLKGSLPAHKDVDVSSWGENAKRTYEDFHSVPIKINMNKHSFNELTEKIGDLYRKTISETELVKWIIDHYQTHVFVESQ